MLAGNNFTQNKAATRGGAVSVKKSSAILTSSTNTFAANRAKVGGAIHLSLSNCTTDTDSMFTSNKADIGGALYAISSSVVLREGLNTFANNEADAYACGAVRLLASSCNVTTGTENHFIRNTARTSGGAFCATESFVVLRGRRNMFDTNNADRGGSIYLRSSTGVIFENITITNSSKEAIYVNDTSLTLFGNNTIAFNHNQAITVTCKNPGYLCSNVVFDGINVIANNEGALLLESSEIKFMGSVVISSNYGKQGQAGSAIYSNVSQILFAGSTLLANNTASTGGVVHMEIMRNVKCTGNLKFVNNVGESVFSFSGAIRFSGIQHIQRQYCYIYWCYIIAEEAFWSSEEGQCSRITGPEREVPLTLSTMKSNTLAPQAS